MKLVKPKVRLIAKPQIDWEEVKAYLMDVRGVAWYERQMSDNHDVQVNDGESLIEFGGRLCYRSWEPGLNPNVTRVREDSDEYLENILKSLHGSVVEHANYSFIFQDVSRVFTHEFVRHRAGVSISQESMRFVRLTEIPFWFPTWATEDEVLMRHCVGEVEAMERHQVWMAEHFGLDDGRECALCRGTGKAEVPEGFVDAGADVNCPPCGGRGRVPVPFAEKKAKTSFMRRFAPDGVATSMLATINIRAIRWVLQQRTEPGAEEEIRLVFDQVGQIMVNEAPALFQDFQRDTTTGQWTPDYRKV